VDGLPAHDVRQSLFARSAGGPMLESSIVGITIVIGLIVAVAGLIYTLRN
jgi:hypothetical protein